MKLHARYVKYLSYLTVLNNPLTQGKIRLTVNVICEKKSIIHVNQFLQWINTA
jgi:hypothetical protein